MAKYGRKDESEEDFRRRRAAYAREWRRRNKEHYAAYANDYQRRWRSRNRQSWKESHRKSRVALRKQVLGFFGGVCSRCGFDDWRALQLDHIHGGGTRDLSIRHGGGVRPGGPSMTKLRIMIRDNPEAVREKLQCLCANCNWIKRHENDECRKRAKASGGE